MPPRNYILKLCLLGDGAVGKTSLVRRYVYDVFDDKYISTFGTKVTKKSLVSGDAQIDLMIWDILGQKVHGTLHAAYYKGAAGALAVCDYSRPETMRSLPAWIDDFRSVVGNVPVIVLGNKADLPKAFEYAELKAFVEPMGCEVLETSAKTGQNVELAFAAMSRKLIEVTA